MGRLVNYSQKYIRFFPEEYDDYTDDELHRLICEHCGESFGVHYLDKCHYAGEGRFIPPSLHKSIKFELPESLFEVE